MPQSKDKATIRGTTRGSPLCVKKRCPWLWQFWNAIPCQRLTIHRRLWGTATLELLQLCLNQKIGAVPEDAYDIVKINMQREKV
jgi:hypothetical protein